MGLLTSNTEDNFDKYNKISSKEGKKILNYTDKKTKGKLKKYINRLENEEKSIHQVSQEIQEELGRKIKEEFIHAAKKHAGGGLTKKEKRRNLAKRREENQEEGSTGYVSSTASFAGGEVESSHRVSMQGRGSDNAGGSSSFAQKPAKRSVSINDSSSKSNTAGGGKKGGSLAGKKGGGKEGGGNKPMGF